MAPNPQKVTLSGAMPEKEHNGLAEHAKTFMDSPHEAVLVVALVSASKKVENLDNGTEYPVLRIRHWEVVPQKSIKTVSKALGDALAARTGKAELPFPPGEEIPVDFEADDSFAESVEADEEQ